MNVLIIALGSEGDVLPLVHLGVALKRRGHAVTMVTSGYFEVRVRRAGLELIALGTAEDYLALIDHPDVWHPTRAPKFMAEHGVIPLIKPLYEIASQVDPASTVILAPFVAFGARVASETTGVRLATYYMQPAYLRSFSDPPVVASIPVPSWSRRFVSRFVFWGWDRLMDKLFLPSINAFRAEIGLPDVQGHCYDWMDSPQCILGFFPDWFAKPQADWRPQIRLTGFLHDTDTGEESLPAEVSGFLDAGSPPILFTAGTAMRRIDEGRQFFEESAAACDRLGRRGLFLTRFSKQVPAALPESVRHFDYIPFSAVLPRVGAIVHHGGIGTLAAGLAAGIPQLIVPRAHDQPDNAARLARLGVGTAVSPSAYRARRVAEQLEPLMSSAVVRRSCEAAERSFHANNPMDRACRLVEDLLKATS